MCKIFRDRKKYIQKQLHGKVKGHLKRTRDAKNEMYNE